MTTICPIEGFDHLEFYVGNAKQASVFYSTYFGFNPVAYCGLETGERKKTSYVLKQGDIRFVISSALSPNHPIARSVLEHGDTIAIIALAVSNVNTAYQYAVARGAVGAIPPTTQKDESGVFRFAAIHSFGDTLIKFIDRSDYPSNFAPGYIDRVTKSVNSAGLTSVDHVVGNVERGTMNQWVKFFVKTMGFDVRMYFDEQTVSTEYSALMSKVLENGGKTIININEPANGLRKSQIQEYLDFHYGPGIQHLGLATNNIVQTVVRLREAGVEFLPIPQTYYENLEDWVKDINVSVEDLAKLGILVDRDDNGYLLQLFTKPISDRPTLFFEIIERRGSQGFGAGNFKSLFVALEKEQKLRGNF
ncbi:4-hydroxyphenylpyruvate dioxygenase [Pleurocapsa sp. PCC 7319]|uniref:4-hydroxyphenylpyruvate dioxygenase n=1 Tax=Pleurocapsa sp. PCC 7319 TaxID=118161 RepID=UPI0003470649|nr:4-hydroxyphenylpyruvate dioxygenase [Pleurocapsa sp. PCC 7319]